MISEHYDQQKCLQPTQNNTSDIDRFHNICDITDIYAGDMPSRTLFRERIIKKEGFKTSIHLIG